jgi:hypothetical protein
MLLELLKCVTEAEMDLKNIIASLPIVMFVQSKVSDIFCHSSTAIVSSNPTRGMDL